MIFLSVTRPAVGRSANRKAPLRRELFRTIIAVLPGPQLYSCIPRAKVARKVRRDALANDGREFFCKTLMFQTEMGNVRFVHPPELDGPVQRNVRLPEQIEINWVRVSMNREKLPSCEFDERW